MRFCRRLAHPVFPAALRPRLPPPGWQSSRCGRRAVHALAAPHVRRRAASASSSPSGWWSTPARVRTHRHHAEGGRHRPAGLRHRGEPHHRTPRAPRSRKSAVRCSARRSRPGDQNQAPRREEAPTDVPWRRRRWIPDAVLLFRFSALTFNSHRIHYDRAWAMDVEGYPELVVHGPLIVHSPPRFRPRARIPVAPSAPTRPRRARRSSSAPPSSCAAAPPPTAGAASSGPCTPQGTVAMSAQATFA